MFDIYNTTVILTCTYTELLLIITVISSCELTAQLLLDPGEESLLNRGMETEMELEMEPATTL